VLGYTLLLHTRTPTLALHNMSKNGLAIIIGAGPTSGGGIARYLASQGLAVAVLARTESKLQDLCKSIRGSVPEANVHAFATDTSPPSLAKAFKDISSHSSFANLKLRLAIYHVKHSSKEPFLSTSPESFGEALQTYTTGAFAFAQESVKLMYAQNGGETTLADTDGQKKGTIIFTGTLGALRANAEYAAYGSTRAAARSVAQALAKEVSKNGIHVVHAIANGSIKDEDSHDTRTGVKMSAAAVGAEYLHLMQQSPSLWVHEVSV
jgi:NAD(P)-dependent dehydrogenase (short-subunit alcohol dehydrogenase family)